MVGSDSAMVLIVMQVVEWRSAWMAYGVQYVMMAGTAMMPLQCADNWDITTVCNIIYNIYK